MGAVDDPTTRLETLQRRASLELLLPLAQAYRRYVHAGRIRLVFGDHDLVLGASEVAECDTRVPHWFGSAGEHAAGILGPQGARVHTRASSTQKQDRRN
jgi:hypothetical protein